MSDHSDQIATIIAETHRDIPRDTITPGQPRASTIWASTASIFLDIAFAIDKAFGIKLPLEKWTQEVQRRQGHDQRAVFRPEEPRRAHPDELVAAKGGPTLDHNSRPDAT